MLDTPNDAQNVLLGSGFQTFTGGVSSFDSADYYKLQVNSRSNVAMSLYGLSTDANLSLYDNNFRLITSSSNSGSTSESINTTLDGGAFFVKVDRSNLANTNGTPYKLSIANDPLFRNIDDKNPNGQMFYDGDFNGDKIRDIFRQERGNWVNGVNDAQVYLGTASDSYSAPIQVNNSGLFEGNHNRLIFSDFNGDGKTDIIRQETNDWINGVNDTQFVTFQNGNFQVFGNLPDMNMMRGDLTNLIAADVNNDGRDDLIRQEKGTWVNGVRDVEVYISNGTFGWSSQTVLTNAFSVNGNDTLLVAGDYIAGGGKDLMRVETTNSIINGVNDIQFLTYQNGNMQVVSNNPINTAPQSLTINGVKTSYDFNSTLTIAPSFVSDNNGWQDITKVDFWLTDAQNRRIELADVSSFTANGQNSARFDYSTSLNGIAIGSYKLNAIGYDKAGAATNIFTQAFAIDLSNQTLINDRFTQLGGSNTLGKAVDSIRTINGLVVQDYE